MKKLRILAWLWVSVLLFTGGVGCVVVSKVGWSLAMGLAIYAGNTEPGRPDLPFPWLLFAVGALMAMGGLAWVLWRRRAAGPAPSGLAAILPLAVAYLGGLLAAVLPFVQVYRLWSQIT